MTRVGDVQRERLIHFVRPPPSKTSRKVCRLKYNKWPIGENCGSAILWEFRREGRKLKDSVGWR